MCGEWWVCLRGRFSVCIVMVVCVYCNASVCIVSMCVQLCCEVRVTVVADFYSWHLLSS